MRVEEFSSYALLDVRGADPMVAADPEAWPLVISQGTAVGARSRVAWSAAAGRRRGGCAVSDASKRTARMAHFIRTEIVLLVE